MKWYSEDRETIPYSIDRELLGALCERIAKTLDWEVVSDVEDTIIIKIRKDLASYSHKITIRHTNKQLDVSCAFYRHLIFNVNETYTQIRNFRKALASLLKRLSAEEKERLKKDYRNRVNRFKRYTLPSKLSSPSKREFLAPPVFYFILLSMSLLAGVIAGMLSSVNNSEHRILLFSTIFILFFLYPLFQIFKVTRFKYTNVAFGLSASITTISYIITFYIQTTSYINRAVSFIPFFINQVKFHFDIQNDAISFVVAVIIVLLTVLIIYSILLKTYFIFYSSHLFNIIPEDVGNAAMFITGQEGATLDELDEYLEIKNWEDKRDRDMVIDAVGLTFAEVDRRRA